MCVYGGGAVPQRGGGGHLVTTPHGLVGDRLPWVGNDKGGGRVLSKRAVYKLLIAVDCAHHMEVLQRWWLRLYKGACGELPL